ncbi:MAG TPA: hypothetical protein PKC72_06150 [Chitinophagaceae bacterium]|nr:hypothetical protein [Chitinophagaceae bacterium]
MSYTSVSHCGTDHSQWLKSIDFYKDDLITMEDRLLEIVKKNNSKEAMAGIEHFQNQFILQRNNMHDLMHAIHEHDHRIASEAKEHAGKVETILASEHDNLKDQFESFEKIFNELRHEFNLFLSKWS